jgi:ribonuclease P/MRP protein subunit POP5
VLSYSVKYLSPATSTAIIRCPRHSYRLVWAALTYMSSLPTKVGRGVDKSNEAKKLDCVFRVVKVSGTMRKAEEEAIRRARREVLRVRKGGEEGGMKVLEELFGSGEGRMDVDVDVESDEEEDEDEDD